MKGAKQMEQLHRLQMKATHILKKIQRKILQEQTLTLCFSALCSVFPSKAAKGWDNKLASLGATLFKSMDDPPTEWVDKKTQCSNWREHLGLQVALDFFFLSSRVGASRFPQYWTWVCGEEKIRLYKFYRNVWIFRFFWIFWFFLDSQKIGTLILVLVLVQSLVCRYCGEEVIKIVILLIKMMGPCF